MNWPEFVSNLQIGCAISSLILNSILIILIIKKSPKKLGSYRYLMSYIAFFEMFFSILDVFLSPTIFSHGSMYFVIISGIKNGIFPKCIYFLLNCIWCGCIGSFMAFFAIQFIYRFCVVNDSKKILKSFDDYRIVFWMLIPILFGILLGLIVCFLIGPNAETDHAISDLLLTSLDMKIDDITYIGPRCFERTADNQFIIFYKAIIAIIIIFIISTTSLIIVIFFGFKTFLKFRMSFEMISKQENNLQLQTFYALVSQTLIPMILMHFPCTIVLISTLSDFDLGHFSSIATVTFALFPALDPLPVMLIIKNYRGTLFNVVTTPVNIFVRRKTVI
ncbi:unnamed protein product [Caenorhabditis angaria]|uniref:Seven TM Receptor n=1 Tax=Caenorhabditis angaria TaxID=860376 RepID=A0A9P1N1A9_9PELO|nr:unnamed protein product [Caenorhabditis angaria]